MFSRASGDFGLLNFSICSGDFGLPRWDCLCFSLVSGVCFLLSLVCLSFSICSGDCFGFFLPRLACLILSTASGEYPLARADCLCLALVSSEAFLLFMFSISSGVCFLPRLTGLPRVGAVASRAILKPLRPNGLSLFNQYCSLFVGSSGKTSSTTSKTKACSPYLFQAFCKCGLVCLFSRSRYQCAFSRLCRLTALPM